MRPSLTLPVLAVGLACACAAPVALPADPEAIAGTEVSPADIDRSLAAVVTELLVVLPERPNGEPWRLLFERFENLTSQVAVDREYLADILTHKLVQTGGDRIRLYVGMLEDWAQIVSAEQELGVRDGALPPPNLVTPDLLLHAQLTELARLNEIGRTQQTVFSIKLSDLQGGLRASFQKDVDKSEMRHDVYR